MSSQFDLEEEIFSTALQFANAEERDAYLLEACGEDSDLRRHVAELLEAHEQSGAFLDSAPGAQPAPEHTRDRMDKAGENPGDFIGPYELLEKIGEGGFGVIYKAQQRGPLRRTVALKIIKLGMDTRHVVARFEAERQALALMDHPNIAKVLDAGATPSGRPFFIMDLVPGIAISEYCDREQLTTRERLELFLKVCHAVEHAHQKGIVHRDLKPSNILVAKELGEAVPKVIDFGIAKALEADLTDKTLLTRAHQMVGTPAYMSPEQASFGSQDVDTRTDVYSLGVVLYELLTGQTPIDPKEFDEANLGNLTRVAREVNPPKPSSRFSHLPAVEQTTVAERRRSVPERLRRQIRGELDWIAIRALEKDRSRRYQSASGFAEDIVRFLNHEPVTAGAPGTLYRLGKFVQRNKAACLTAAAFAVLLLAGTAISIGFALRATEAEGRAEKSFRDERAARMDATDELWRSYLSRARAGRLSRRIGQKFDGLDAVNKAAAIRTSIELRDEAIACLARPDLKLVQSWSTSGLSQAFVFADPRRRIIAANAPDGTVRVFSLDENRELFVLPGEGIHSHNLEFGPRGRFLAVNYHHRRESRPLQVWDLTTTTPVLAISDAVATDAVDFAPAPSAPIVAVGRRDRSVVLYDLNSKHQLANLRLPFHVYRIRFSPDGNLLAISSDLPSSKVQIWEWREQRVLQEFSSSTGVYDLAWSPNGSRLATGGSDYLISVWNWRSRTMELSLAGHRGEVVDVRYDRSGTVLLSVAWDGTVRLWDARTGVELLVSTAPDPIVGSDGRFISRDGDQFNLFEIATSQELALVHDPPLLGKDTHPVFSPDGMLFLSPSPQGVRLWSAGNRQPMGRLPTGLTRAVLFDTKGKRLWTVGAEGISQWPMTIETSAREPLRRHLVGPPVQSFPGRKFNHGVLSPDGKWLICSEAGDDVRIIAADDGRLVRSMPGQPGLVALDIHASGRWLAGSSWHGRGIRIWDLDTFEPVANLLEEFPNVRAQFSPDGTSLVTGDGTAYRFWEVETWRPTIEISRQEAGTSPGVIGFSPGGQYVAVAITRSTVLLADASTGRALARFEPPNPVFITGITFSPDGRTLTVGNIARTIQLWDLEHTRAKLAKLDLDWTSPRMAARDPTAEKLLTACTVLLHESVARKERLGREEFDGSFKMDWEIRNPSAEHYAFQDAPGSLTVTTLPGGFYDQSSDYKNLFLMESTIASDSDFEATLAIKSFEPLEPSQQVALVLFADEDNYLEWSWEWHQPHQQPVLAINREQGGKIFMRRIHVLDGGKGRFGLRIARIGRRYVFSWSPDGETFEELEFADFEMDGPIRVAWIAKNGSGSKAAEIPVVIDDFEVWSLEKTSENGDDPNTSRR